MRYRKRYRKPTKTVIVAKFAGTCACCGAPIAAGTMVDYYPPGTIAGRPKGAIAHMGGLEGTGATCTAELRKRHDPGFVDLDRAFEDACAETCGH